MNKLRGVDRKAPLADLYAQEMIDEIVGGLDVAQRWGVAEGQLSLASKMINSQAINRVLRQYIDDQIDASGRAEFRCPDDIDPRWALRLLQDPGTGS